MRRRARIGAGAAPGVVGRTPWSAADAPVGLLLARAGANFAGAEGSGSRGTRADQGVRPTKLKGGRMRPGSRS